MEAALADYLRHLGIEKNSSAYTVKSYREDLTQALSFFREKLGSTDAKPDRITTRLLRAYLPGSTIRVMPRRRWPGASRPSVPGSAISAVLAF